MKKYLAYGIIIIGLLGFFYFNNKTEVKDTQVYQPLNEENNNIKHTSEDAIYYVEIRGEVRFPNVYQIRENEILKTLIDKAGGLTEEADISMINQAAIVEKNSLIVIPKVIKEDFHEEVPTTEVDIVENYIYVDVKGEVNNPGVYWVKASSRVFEVIDLAGGLTSLADTSGIYLSEIVKDGSTIIVPKLDEVVDITVQITGAINRPGYYQLPAGSTLEALIAEAGGLTVKADKTTINYHLSLTDGDVITVQEMIVIEKIYVSIKGEVINPGVYYVEETISVKDLITLAGGLTEYANAQAINYNQTLILGSIVLVPKILVDDYEPITEPSGLININTASLDELQTLKGIGEILGQRIIDYRNEYGYFQNIEDIQLVSGIKSSIYEEIKDFITVG
ncbi:MAG: SLBB domain-containing protein [Candidatus Izemoplasmatales bacterium]|nr:SLBB domain-containing protein [Candidatus Izemoplasmatales bacterium]